MTDASAAAAAMNLDGEWLGFDELGTRRLHDLLRLRQDVFVVEQDCAFPEIDGKDPQALHYLLVSKSTGAIAGALRIFLPESVGGPSGATESRIGRVVTAPGYRGTGLGRRLMAAGVAKCLETAPGTPIHLSAQAHLENFYKDFGFERVSQDYLEDGIPHVDMIRVV
ncbi:GNAT family N-acetyltransferase [Roseibium sp.]|uniref:GNAT family N-acetyltransferase n=1 Tax=Roseibium sp. TaxID=1936156 RepID=UPI003A9811C3